MRQGFTNANNSSGHRKRNTVSGIEQLILCLCGSRRFPSQPPYRTKCFARRKSINEEKKCNRHLFVLPRTNHKETRNKYKLNSFGY